MARHPSPPSDRDRLDLRVEPAWLARVRRQADRFGMSVSAYIRAATTERLERDESTDDRPEPKRK